MEGGEENGIPDMEWVDEVRENERKEAGRLDVELRGYMSNLIKESIRVSQSPFQSQGSLFFIPPAKIRHLPPVAHNPRVKES